MRNSVKERIARARTFNKTARLLTEKDLLELVQTDDSYSDDDGYKTFGRYKCPRCQGLIVNGDPRNGSRFRGGGMCLDCNHSTSVIRMQSEGEISREEAMERMGQRKGEFSLIRKEDETGNSGTGRVAQGFVFEDGTATMRWLTDTRSTALYNNVDELESIHGHGGKTVVLFEVGQNAG